MYDELQFAVNPGRVDHCALYKATNTGAGESGLNQQVYDMVLVVGRLCSNKATSNQWNSKTEATIVKTGPDM